MRATLTAKKNILAATASRYIRKAEAMIENVGRGRFPDTTLIVLAGLEDDQEDETRNRLPFLGWLLGEEAQKKRSEIIVFIEAMRI